LPLRLLRLLGNGFIDFIAKNSRRDTNEYRRQYGLPPMEGRIADSPGRLPLVIIPGCPEFDYMRGDLPPCVKYVGPCLWYPSAWKTSGWLDELPTDKPLVHVTEGTLFAQAPVILKAAVKGLADLPIQVLLTTGTHRKEDLLDLGSLPSNFIVKPLVAHSELIPRLDVLVYHGGGGTTMAALTAGVPMVVTPLMWDQSENAQRVHESGTGIRLSANMLNPRRLRNAIERVLSDPSYRQNAQRLSDILKGYGGSVQAAELLEEIV